MERTDLSFWQKFRELQTKMFWQSDTVQNHMYSSEPLEWPLLTKGIAYWYQKDTNVRQPDPTLHSSGDRILIHPFRLKFICLATLRSGIPQHLA